METLPTGASSADKARRVSRVCANIAIAALVLPFIVAAFSGGSDASNRVGGMLILVSAVATIGVTLALWWASRREDLYRRFFAISGLCSLVLIASVAYLISLPDDGAYIPIAGVALAVLATVAQWVVAMILPRPQGN